MHNWEAAVLLGLAAWAAASVTLALALGQWLGRATARQSAPVPATRSEPTDERALAG